MKKYLIVLVMLAMLVTACAPKAEKVTLRALFMKQASYQESDIQAMTKEFTDKNPNVNVEMDFVTYEALHDKIVTAAAAKAGTYDVVLMDCIWPAEFAAANFILDVSDKMTDDMKKDIWPGALEAVTYQGKVYGMPWVNDVLFLYYNEEMLKAAGFDKPPKTWTELEQMAMAAKEKGVVEYPFIESFPQEEGLTIAFAYYLFAFGGNFFDAENKPAFNSPEGLAALNYMVKGMKEGMYNPASLESTYEEVRNTFSQGSSLFSVNWAYQYNMANDEKRIEDRRQSQDHNPARRKNPQRYHQRRNGSSRNGRLETPQRGPGTISCIYPARMSRNATRRTPCRFGCLSSKTPNSSRPSR